MKFGAMLCLRDGGILPQLSRAAALSWFSLSSCFFTCWRQTGWRGARGGLHVSWWGGGYIGETSKIHVWGAGWSQCCLGQALVKMILNMFSSFTLQDSWCCFYLKPVFLIPDQTSRVTFCWRMLQLGMLIIKNVDLRDWNPMMCQCDQRFDRSTNNKSLHLTPLREQHPVISNKFMLIKTTNLMFHGWMLWILTMASSVFVFLHLLLIWCLWFREVTVYKSWSVTRQHLHTGKLRLQADTELKKRR